MKLQLHLNTFVVFLVSFFLFACGKDDQKSNIAPKENPQIVEKSSPVIPTPDLKGQLTDSQKAMPSPSVPLPSNENKPTIKSTPTIQSKVETPVDPEKKPYVKVLTKQNGIIALELYRYQTVTNM